MKTKDLYLEYSFSIIPPIPTFTEAGRAVWEKSIVLAKKDPTARVGEILKRAMDILGISSVEMTAEDFRSIEMGLEAILSSREIRVACAGSSVQDSQIVNNPADWSTTPGFFVR